MSTTGLQWCPGCQVNVRPTVFGRECPRCGTSMRPDPPKFPFEPEKEVELDFEEEFEFDLEEESDLFSRDLVRTPRSGRLVLNPKVDAPERNPLCPDCEEPIQRVEHDHAPSDEQELTTVEFVCGCDELRYFEFEEREP